MINFRPTFPRFLSFTPSHSCLRKNKSNQKKFEIVKTIACQNQAHFQCYSYLKNNFATTILLLKINYPSTKTQQ